MVQKVSVSYAHTVRGPVLSLLVAQSSKADVILDSSFTE